MILSRSLGFDERSPGSAEAASGRYRGWTIDVHAMRHTFGTLLSRGNVAPRTAQAAMRHSSIDLTMNVYTDPKLLDVAGALGALPELPLAMPSASKRTRLQATGTDDATRNASE